MKPRTAPAEPQDYNGLKAAWDEHVRWQAVAAKLGKPSSLPVVLWFYWHEKDRRRDKDNVRAGGTKIVLDGLVAAGVLPNDGNHTISGFVGDEYLYPGDMGHRGPGVGVMIGVGRPGQWTADRTLWIPGLLPDLNELLAAREYGARKSVFRRGRGGDSFTALARKRGLIP